MQELGEHNPFSDRPTTAQQIFINDKETEASLKEMDNYSNAPAGVDESTWDRFVQFRRQKVAMEASVRMKSLALNEMNAYLHKRQEEDEMKKREIEELSRTAIGLQELRLNVYHNIDIQFLIKQGQVEINPGTGVRNYTNCLLLSRRVVESLNKVILSHGKQKITIMVDCKNLKKGIRQLEWEHKKMKMTIEDYIQKQRDITYLKLSKEIQEVI